MKKLTISILSILLTISMFAIKDPAEVGAASTCDTAPQVYNIVSNIATVSDGTPFVLSVNFYNECNHFIKEVLINGTAYTVGDGEIANTGYTAKLLPNGDREYRIQIPLVFDSSTMATSFTITHFVYTEWYVALPPVDHLVTVQQSWEAAHIFDVDTSNPSDPTTDELRFTVSLTSESGGGVIITNEETGQAETLLYDVIFYASLYANYTGDVTLDLLVNPAATVETFIKSAIDNYKDNTTLAGFATDTIYDVIMADDGISDKFLNSATDKLIEQIQTEDPTYVFPGDYMWVDGNFVEVEIDPDTGDAILDPNGDPIPSEDGNTAGDQPDITMPGWLETALLDFSSIVSSWFGLENDLEVVPWVQWMLDHIGFVLITIIILVIIAITWPVSGPIIIQGLILIPKTAIWIIRGLTLFFQFLANQMYTKNTKKAKF